MAEREAKLLQILLGEFCGDREIDIVVTHDLAIFFEAQVAQPCLQVGHWDSHVTEATAC